MKPDLIRCFAAIEIPERIQALLVEVQNAFRPKIEKASWTKQGNFHFTLKFLGDVEDRNINEISAALQKIAESQTPFSIEIGGIGAFPNLARPRVLWVGLKQGEVPITKLASAVNQELVKFGYSNDTRFHPHLTLARLRNQVNLNSFISIFKKFETIDGALLTVDKITLVKSELHPSGAVYIPLKICEFNKEKADNGK
ncbi:MAG: RNA 2',3'-cyclic phosphodiesterase [Candidatus Poribacteria bacterium]|nr:RNA 2',3'-cyclic phosphodiesterase [Candidatus Poribacteria bacterium]